MGSGHLDRRKVTIALGSQKGCARVLCRLAVGDRVVIATLQINAPVA